MSTPPSEPSTRVFDLEEENAKLREALKGCLNLIKHIRPKCEHHGEVLQAREALKDA